MIAGVSPMQFFASWRLCVRMRFNQVWAVFPLRFGSGVAGASRGRGAAALTVLGSRKGAKAPRTAGLHRSAPRSLLRQDGRRVCQAERGAPGGWVERWTTGALGARGSCAGPDGHRERLGGRAG